LHMTETQWVVVIVLAALAAIAGTLIIASRSSRKRHDQLKARFGPEYDRALAEHGSEAKAERELIAREKRVHKQKLRPLSDPDRVQYSADWRQVQARFVDDPNGAVQAADELIQTVMLTRGYSSKDIDERIADLSVEHAGVIDHYRSAQVLAQANREGRANTEELRQAFVHYRALFSDLLDHSEPPERQVQEQEARA
jgi:hypothetical protein